jgi:hypothetical protein
METLKLSKIHVAHLLNEDAASLFKLSCEIAAPHQPDMGEVLNVAFTRLNTSNDAFVSQINKLYKSELTDDVVAARELCNTVFAEIKRTVVFETKSRDAIKKESALKLDFFLKPFRDITKSPLGTQLELSAELCTKYFADSVIKQAAAKIAIDTLFSEFDVNNQKLGDIYKARNEEISQRESTSTDLRPAASECYQQFCSALEQTVNLTPKPSLIKLFNGIDELRKKYHLLLPKAKKTEKPIA